MIGDVISMLLEKGALSVAVAAKFNSLAKEFVVASAKSAVHARSLAECLLKFSKDNFPLTVTVEGLGVANWIVLDLGELMVHIFLPEVRDYYQVDELWSTKPIDGNADIPRQI